MSSLLKRRRWMGSRAQRGMQPPHVPGRHLPSRARRPASAPESFSGAPAVHKSCHSCLFNYTARRYRAFGGRKKKVLVSERT